MQNANVSPDLRQKAFEKHLDNIIAEQDHEEEDDGDPGSAMKRFDPRLDIPEAKNQQKPFLIAPPDKMFVTPVNKRIVNIQTFVDVRQANGNNQDD